MAVTAYAPSSIVRQVNLTGTLSAIQDDPASPDANWLTATTVGSAIEFGATFPTPPGVLTGTQTFTARVRKSAGTNNPSGRVELWINGVLSSVVVASTVVSGSTLLTGTWNGTGVSPSSVQLYIFAAGSGGGPSARSSLEIGAVQWTANYTPPVAPSQVTGLTVNHVYGEQLNLSWSNPAGDDPKTYTIFRDDVQVATGISGTSYTDTGLAYYTSYSYTVSATNATGTGPVSSAVIGTVPASPKHQHTYIRVGGALVRTIEYARFEGALVRITPYESQFGIAAFGDSPYGGEV